MNRGNIIKIKAGGNKLNEMKIKYGNEREGGGEMCVMGLLMICWRVFVSF